MDWEAILLLAAVLVQGALALGLVWYLGLIRVPLIAQGKVRIKDIAISKLGWPDRAQQVSNAVDNQFQLPVLFFVAAVISLNMGPILVETLFAWAFVLSRLVHAYIHVTHNRVVQRFWAYTIGLAFLTLFWLTLCVRLVVVATVFGT